MSAYLIEDDFRAIGLSMGVREVALGDAWLQFESFDGSARDYFTARKADKAHWFDAPGADTVEHAAFHSLAAQGAYVREHGEAATVALLKTEGLKLGQIKAPAKVDGETIKGSNNPYSESFKGTAAEREARIASLIKSGTSLAASLAKAAGKTIDNRPLQAVGAARMGKR
jgi:hypothetical protein